MRRHVVLNDLGVPILAALSYLPTALTIVATLFGIVFYGIQIWESETWRKVWRKNDNE